MCSSDLLPSIAAVAQVELRTRVRGAELGTRLEIDGSELIDISHDACPEGAIFSVKNLFFNIPARRKFLKSNETEFRNILSEFERVVLANPRQEKLRAWLARHFRHRPSLSRSRKQLQCADASLSRSCFM